MHFAVRPLPNILQRLLNVLIAVCDLGQVVSIEILPDDVLLAIFNFYADESSFLADTKEQVEGWQTLVHVSRRWRSIVFGSPCRLNLRLGCTSKTPARDLLDVWPALPLLIWIHGNNAVGGVDNSTAALQRSDRVCEIDLWNVPNSHLEKISAAMQVPFPKLTDLVFDLNDDIDETSDEVDEMPDEIDDMPVLPDSFLGGSAPRLQFLQLDRVPFPGLPNLLLSAPHLTALHIINIPHCGYFPPEAMVTALSTLTSLRSLSLGFYSPLSRPDWANRRPPPLTRSVLPDLVYFFFKGVSEYLEDIVARIDTPRLDHLSITFFNQIEFDTPQSILFIGCTPTFKSFKTALLLFGRYGATFELPSQTRTLGSELLTVDILCKDVDWQISSLEQVCTSSLPPLSTLEDLYISERQHSPPHWQDNIENTLWLELLHPFASAKNLYLSGQVAPRIVPALQELVGTRTMEVLPTLQNIFLEELQPSGPVQEGIERFVATRQAVSRPIVVSRWENLAHD